MNKSLLMGPEGPSAPLLATGCRTLAMSSTEMFAVGQNGDVVPFEQFHNAWGSGMAVWQLLSERYLAPLGHTFFELLRDGVSSLFDLAREGGLEPWEVVVLMTTADRVVIPIEHVESVASAFEKFDEHYGDQMRHKQHAFSIPAQAIALRRMVAEREEGGWRGVCWNQTSVGDALWGGVYEDGENGDPRPYNIDRDSSHKVWPVKATAPEI